MSLGNGLGGGWGSGWGCGWELVRAVGGEVGEGGWVKSEHAVGTQRMVLPEQSVM